MANVIGAGSVPVLQIAGRVYTDLANLKVLVGLGNATPSSNCSMRSGNTAGYQVPGAKSFRVTALEIETVTALAGTTFTFGYCDNDCGSGTATAPTNLVAYGGTAPYSTAVVGLKQYAVNFVVPTGKFVFFGSSGTAIAGVRAYGYEE